jgi:hypothetical protein
LFQAPVNFVGRLTQASLQPFQLSAMPRIAVEPLFVARGPLLPQHLTPGNFASDPKS